MDPSDVQERNSFHGPLPAAARKAFEEAGKARPLTATALLSQGTRRDHGHHRSRCAPRALFIETHLSRSMGGGQPAREDVTRAPSASGGREFDAKVLTHRMGVGARGLGGGPWPGDPLVSGGPPRLQLRPAASWRGLGLGGEAPPFPSAPGRTSLSRFSPTRPTRSPVRPEPLCRPSFALRSRSASRFPTTKRRRGGGRPSRSRVGSAPRPRAHGTRRRPGLAPRAAGTQEVRGPRGWATGSPRVCTGASSQEQVSSPRGVRPPRVVSPGAKPDCSRGRGGCPRSQRTLSVSTRVFPLLTVWSAIHSVCSSWLPRVPAQRDGVSGEGGSGARCDQRLRLPGTGVSVQRGVPRVAPVG